MFTFKQFLAEIWSDVQKKKEEDDKKDQEENLSPAEKRRQAAEKRKKELEDRRAKARLDAEERAEKARSQKLEL